MNLWSCEGHPCRILALVSPTPDQCVEGLWFTAAGESDPGPHTRPLFALHKAGYIDRLGLDNLRGDMNAALARARLLLEQERTTGRGPRQRVRYCWMK